MTKKFENRMLGGTGTLLGPSPNSLFDMVVEFMKLHLPQFVESIIESAIVNENGLNSRLSRFITKAARNDIFFAHRENMEDETRGDSPATDIGIYLYDDDMGISSPLITVFECKRLTKNIGSKRRREYVIGHEKNGKQVHCGGIERFKIGIHGSSLNHAGMVGYIQDGHYCQWLKKINLWVSDLCGRQCDPMWSEAEKLKLQRNIGRITECTSIVKRNKNQLYMTHLWIDLGK